MAAITNKLVATITPAASRQSHLEMTMPAIATTISPAKMIHQHIFIFLLYFFTKTSINKCPLAQ
jgi:hypothetical protein